MSFCAADDARPRLGKPFARCFSTKCAKAPAGKRLAGAAGRRGRGGGRRIGAGKKGDARLPATTYGLAMSKARFIHLRTHTEYSLLEGAMPLRELVALKPEEQLSRFNQKWPDHTLGSNEAIHTK